MSQVTVLFDGQAGSCGKGKIAAIEALDNQPDIVVSTFGPNAGHTVHWHGKKMVFRHLPAGAVHVGADIFIAASATIDAELLEREIAECDALGLEVSKRLSIHPRVAVIHAWDADADKRAVTAISSTGKGTGPAAARKILRIDANLASADRFCQQYVDVFRRNDYLANCWKRGMSIQIETSQGYDLCINHGIAYPYCTSRQVGPAQALADCGLPAQALSRSVAVIRPYPIRVGNAPGSYSGPWGAGSFEMSWGDIFDMAKVPADKREEYNSRELTTVTKRVRRVASFSWQRYNEMIAMCGPNAIYLNHADHLDYSIAGKSGDIKILDLPIAVHEFVFKMATQHGFELAGVGTGPDVTDMVRVRWD